jgi:hypothetical protein
LITAAFGFLWPGLASAQEVAKPQGSPQSSTRFPLQIGLWTGEPRFSPADGEHGFCFRGMDDGQRVDLTVPLETRRYYGLYLGGSEGEAPPGSMADRYVYVLGWGDNRGIAQRTVLWPVTCHAAGVCACATEPDRARLGARLEDPSCPVPDSGHEVPLVTILDRLPGARTIVLLSSSKPIDICARWMNAGCDEENGSHCETCSGIRCEDPYGTESLRASLAALVGSEVWHEVPIRFVAPQSDRAP